MLVVGYGGYPVSPSLNVKLLNCGSSRYSDVNKKFYQVVMGMAWQFPAVEAEARQQHKRGAALRRL